MKITYFGHSCFGLQIGDYKILFDPFITYNELAKGIDVSAIETEYILLSHAHQDHTADAEVIAGKNEATIIANWEIHAWYEKLGIKTHPMNIGGKWHFDFGTVTMTPAVHSSSFADGTYGGNPGGFVVESADHAFYYSGDTALFTDMQLIADQHKLDFAFLPIGDNFTMGIQDAIRAAKWLGVKKVIAMHFDTFPYIAIDHQETMTMAIFNEIELIIPKVGETFSF
jgi:L-ascorbate metabolism protein UlaG (beta-lactamase superfamily)